MANENTRFIRAGRYGTKSTSYPRVTGNGTKTTPHDIETLDWQGNLVLAGSITCAGGGISCAGAISTSSGGISCAGDIETSNGDIIATGDGVVGGRFDAGGGGSFGGNLGVTGSVSSTSTGYFGGGLTAHSFNQPTSSTATSYLRDINIRQLTAGTYAGEYDGIVSHKPLVLDGEGTDGDVRISGRFYDADGPIRLAGNYINNVRINKYSNFDDPGRPFYIQGLANFTLLTQYEIPGTGTYGTHKLIGVCEALTRLGFYSTTDPDEKHVPFAGYVMPASGYSRRGSSNPAKIVVGLYCSNYDASVENNNTLKVICYDVVNNTYVVETWKGYMTAQEEGTTSIDTITEAVVNSYPALEPVPETTS